MAFRASNINLPKGLESAKTLAADLKVQIQQAITALAASNQSANAVIQLNRQIGQVRAAFQAIAAIPGIAQYARDAENDQTYDVVTEAQSLIATLTAALDWTATNFPASGGFLLKDTLNADGSISVRVFTPAQTATYRAVLQTVVDAIA